jgi:hypothetical protein
MAETCGSDRIDLSVFEDLDVFGAFDVAAGHELDIDPYPVLAELRRRGPILPIDLHDPLGVDHSFLITAQSSGYTDLDAPTYSAIRPSTRCSATRWTSTRRSTAGPMRASSARP